MGHLSKAGRGGKKRKEGRKKKKAGDVSEEKPPSWQVIYEVLKSIFGAVIYLGALSLNKQRAPLPLIMVPVETIPKPPPDIQRPPDIPAHRCSLVEHPALPRSRPCSASPPGREITSRIPGKPNPKERNHPSPAEGLKVPKKTSPCWIKLRRICSQREQEQPLLPQILPYTSTPPLIPIVPWISQHSQPHSQPLLHFWLPQNL